MNDFGVDDDKPVSQINDYIQSHLFDINVKPDPQTFILYHDGTPIVSRGNLFSISGPAKSRKSVVVSAMMSCMLNKQSSLGFTANLNENDLIFHMDTEQAYFHYYNTVKRTIELSGMYQLPKYFKSIRTRDAGSSGYRVQIMKQIFELYKPTVFFLDGITDLMDDINDNGESSELSNILLQLSDKYGTAIGVVIHETKSTNKLRGAIGTTITNKVECSISVELDEKNDIASHVRCKDSRNKKFDPFTIVQDGPNGEVRLANDDEVKNIESRAQSKGKKFNPGEFSEDDNLKMLEALSNYSNGKYEKTLMEKTIRNYSFNIYGRELKITECRDMIKYYFQNKWIINDTEGNYIIIPLNGNKNDDLPF
ncbi:MAG: hypothetical protein EX285_08030 [Thaumarchaeota archaeon]|nr:hypothetical protein [Nitrososphaerota archaeon]